MAYANKASRYSNHKTSHKPAVLLTERFKMRQIA